MRARTLVIGWGNPGRLDDGLGPAFIECLAERAPSDVDLDSDYQLTMEDAAEVARYERVVFVDADRACTTPFHLRRVRPSRRGSSFSTHSVAPGAVLSLGKDLFGGEPEAWLLGIRGRAFDAFGEGLSAPARENLSRAVTFFLDSLKSDTFREEGAGAEPTTPVPEPGGDRCPTPSP